MSALMGLARLEIGPFAVSSLATIRQTAVGFGPSLRALSQWQTGGPMRYRRPACVAGVLVSVETIVKGAVKLAEQCP